MGMNQGIKSRNVRRSTAPKVEPRSKRIREPAVAQIGGNYGDHTTNKGETGWRPGSIYGGAGYNQPVGPTNMALEGPGAGKNAIMKSGGQGTHGAVSPGNAPAKNRDILSDFGPDYRK
jgi:hypothetical protein